MEITKHNSDPGINSKFKTVYGFKSDNKDIKEECKDDKVEKNTTDKVVDFSFVKDEHSISDLLQDQFSWKE